ncbi:unnamed protein product [Ectocarpus sp. CCAP 1310/34]|nr:unnamed protein product [Ectocarpus sp. CCAP 1310/34]
MSSPQPEEWKGACSKEMVNLRKHNVFNLVPLSSVPKGEKILATKFVFKTKLDGQFKARLVVGGHRQEPGQDYGRSYAPLCRIRSIRMTYAFGCHNDWPIYQLDVVGAFLTALCDRDVYVRPAPGTSAKNSATHGGQIKTEPLRPIAVAGALERHPGRVSHGVRMKKDSIRPLRMTDMGGVKRILGIDVERVYEQGTLAISQEHYVNTLLERFGMQEANPASTPGYGAGLSTNQPQDQILGPADKKIYQSTTGSIPTWPSARDSTSLRRPYNCPRPAATQRK